MSLKAFTFREQSDETSGSIKSGVFYRVSKCQLVKEDKEQWN
jgi:hypothetical protein